MPEYSSSDQHHPLNPNPIAILTPSVRMLGARQSLLQLAVGLDRERFIPHVICPWPGGLEQRLRAAQVAVEISPLPPWRKGKNMLLRPWHLWRLRRVMERIQPRLIHSNEFHSHPYAAAIARKTGVPTLVHVRLSITERQIQTYRLTEADRVIVVSNAVAHDFSAFPQIQDRIRVVHNGLDFEAFMQDADGTAFRRETGISEDAILFGQIGLISQRKQQHAAIEAFNRVSDGRPRLHLCIVGDATPSEAGYHQEVRDAAQRSPASNRIHFIPFREKIRDVFAAIDVNLLISNEEGFGRVIVEAAAFEKPSIGARTGGIPEVIDDQRTGLLVPCDDTGELAQAIARLHNDEALRRSLGRAAADDCRRRFSIQTHVEQMMQIYEEVLTRPSHHDE
ncbi:glycosyltransferase family 4 protein [Candidatus Sumerlaeota bacterium]|nr:glycosyltransferase family 4 protein [Candidatus Sumerlaeota bacterium]